MRQVLDEKAVCGLRGNEREERRRKCEDRCSSRCPWLCTETWPQSFAVLSSLSQHPEKARLKTEVHGSSRNLPLRKEFCLFFLLEYFLFFLLEYLLSQLSEMYSEKTFWKWTVWKNFEIPVLLKCTMTNRDEANSERIQTHEIAYVDCCYFYCLKFFIWFGSKWHFFLGRVWITVYVEYLLINSPFF